MHKTGEHRIIVNGKCRTAGTYKKCFVAKEERLSKPKERIDLVNEIVN